MLKSLTIKNIALITNLTVEFGENLCVLTGETGAGKSIIVDSLAFVLGAKTDKTLIKSGEEKAAVEAVFEIEENSIPYIVLQEFGFEAETTIALYRVMNLQGKNECRLNGKLCALSVLKAVATTLVDIFGQSEHVNFLQKETHLKIIDNFKKFEEIEYLYEVVNLYNDEKSKLKEFGGSESERERTLSLLEYEIKEIENAELSVQEEENLISTKEKAANVEKIAEGLKNSISHLAGSNNIASEIWLASTSLNSISKFDKDLDDISSKIQTIKYELDDIIDLLDSKLSECNYNPAEIDAITARLEQIKRIKRKYGATITDVLSFLESSKQRYNDLLDSSAKIEEITKKMSALKATAYQISKRLSAFREKTSDEFSALIYNELCDLGMPNATFSVQFGEKPNFEDFIPSTNGFDTAEFMFSANKGEPQKPLTKVISGGEMSRFLLAVKNITARIESIPTMIFDEIDVGLSGNIAQIVAKKLANISRDYQCIVITHLPQVAAMGDNNYYISKTVDNDKTTTSVKPADKTLKIKEIERLIGGENIGQYSLKHAEEMLEWANDYKKQLN